jgi:hypothetical protein
MSEAGWDVLFCAWFLIDIMLILIIAPDAIPTDRGVE